MINPTICVMTNDNNLWLLKGFIYCFNKFWSSKQKVIVFGFSRPTFSLPENFSFHSLEKYNVPARWWSNYVLKMLNFVPPTFIFMLEDYWLYDKVDAVSISKLQSYVLSNDNILRLDLSGDRSRNRFFTVTETVDGINVGDTPSGSEYQMSFQAAIWRREKMAQVLEKGENPWESEINGTERLSSNRYLRVMGTSKTFLKYSPVYRSRTGKFSLQNIPSTVQSELENVGALKRN